MGGRHCTLTRCPAESTCRKLHGIRKARGIAINIGARDYRRTAGSLYEIPVTEAAFGLQHCLGRARGRRRGEIDCRLTRLLAVNRQVGQHQRHAERLGFLASNSDGLIKARQLAISASTSA